jgi:small conductance mechanosensitive channel
MSMFPISQDTTAGEAQDRLAQALEHLAAAIEKHGGAVASQTTAAAEASAAEAHGGLALPTDWKGLEATLVALKERIVEFVPSLLAAIAILVLGWICARVLTGFLRRALGKSRIDPTLSNFLASCAQMGLMAFVVVSAITQLGVNTASFIAVLGAAGFAVGFAMQGSLSNFAAGVMLMIFRPLRAGDMVEAGGITGVVEEVGVFNTVMTTGQNHRAIVANSSITGGNIINHTANGRLRVDMRFGIGYGDDMDVAMAILRRVMEQDPRVLKSPATVIACVAHGASSVDIVCRPFVKPNDYWDVWFDTHKRVKEEFAAEGISIPFPQHDVHLYNASA